MSLTNSLLVYKYNNLALLVKIVGDLCKDNSKDLLIPNKYSILSIDLYKPNSPKYGNIYYAQIKKFHKSLNCYIVDLGNNNLGLLKNNKQNLTFLNPITLGKKFLCMITKEGDLSKSPIVSPYITLEGLYCDFSPLKNNVSFTPYINDSKTKNEEFISCIQKTFNIPNGITIKSKVNSDNLIQDIISLEQLWKHILNYPKHKLGLIHEPSSISYMICEDLNFIPTNIIVNSLSLLDNIKNDLIYFKNFLNINVIYHSLNSIFFDLFNNIENYLGNIININNEITLHIHNTQALTFIDIDYKGNKTLTKEDALFNANLTTIPYIVKIIKLRNIVGQIFIDVLKIRKNKDILLHKYKEVFQKHIIDANILGYTRLGIIEIERSKKRSSIVSKLFSNCYMCNNGLILNKHLIHLKTIIQIRNILEKKPLSILTIKGSLKNLTTFKQDNKTFLSHISNNQISYIIDETIINSILVY